MEKCRAGFSGSGFCGAAAYCDEPYDCCAQCTDICNSFCGWLPKNIEVQMKEEGHTNE